MNCIAVSEMLSLTYYLCARNCSKSVSGMLKYVVISVNTCSGLDNGRVHPLTPHDLELLNATVFLSTSPVVRH